jgi:hypothetical protein
VFTLPPASLLTYAEKPTTPKLNIQAVLLVINPRGSKHVEGVKNLIQALT